MTETTNRARSIIHHRTSFITVFVQKCRSGYSACYGSDSYRASHGDAHLSQKDTYSSSREDFTSSREVFTTRSTQVGETLMEITPNHPIVEVGKPDHPMADVGNTDDRGDVRKHGSGNAIHIEMLSTVSICAFLRKQKDASAYVLRCTDERGTGICTNLQSYTEGPHNHFQGMLPISVETSQ